ncbi:hypothetical protein SEUCBS140593_004957 [Sporothrix eucalyptigena]|uniref:F-box domain-containing protein n=1 Tax=Sporothrix eucalyptigena TaxID=1812306 RepID=A0ABP0BSF2_9PEZI
MAATDRIFTDELIERPIHKDEYLLEDMIKYQPPPPTKPPSNASLSSPSSLGCLDCLPLEDFHMVMNQMDGQSLVRLSRTSRRAKVVVDNLPAYRELREYCPTALVALGKTRILLYHTVAHLQEALRSRLCTSCSLSFGGFLFLPTADRVCFDCLALNRGLWMTTIHHACVCFRVPRRALEKHLPVLRTVGPYGGRWWLYPTSTVDYLVPVGAAKALAVDIHGSEEAARALLPTERDVWANQCRRPLDASYGHYAHHTVYRAYHEAPLVPPRCDLTVQQRRHDDPYNW